MNVIKWILLSAVVILIGLAAGGYALANRPLDPPLELVAAPASAPAAQAGDPPQMVAAASAATPTSPPASLKSNGICAASGSQTLLVLGLASPLDDPPRGADAIRLVKVNYDEPSIRVLALPPDLWVETPAVAGQGIDETTLTLVYWYAREAARGSQKRVTVLATQALAQTILDNFAFVPGKYVTVDQPEFAGVVDELGGIDLVLPAEVDGTPEGYGVFPAGSQTLDGQRTLDFVRLLHPVGGPSPDEWGRFQRQNLVLRAILEAALRPANWPSIPDLASSFRALITTDLSLKQVAELTCLVKEAGAQATFLEVSPEMVTIDAQGRMLPDVEQIKALIAQLNGE